MKRLRRVSANYIPDMTERYPEGMSNVSDFDAIEEIVHLLEENNIDCGPRHDF